MQFLIIFQSWRNYEYVTLLWLWQEANIA